MSAKSSAQQASAARLRAGSAGGHSFAALPDRGDLVGYPQKPIVQQDGAYTWHRADLSEAHAIGALASGVMEITTPSGEALKFRHLRHVEHPSGDWTWVGALQDGAASDQVIITFGEKGAFGTIAQPDKSPLRLTVRGGKSWLVETDPSRIALINSAATRPRKPDYLIPPAMGISPSGASSTTTASAAPAMAGADVPATNVVDVLLGYTAGFAAAANGGPITRLNNLVEITNQAYINSGVDARVRLVHALQVDYPDNTSNDSTLEEMTGFRAPSTRTTPAPAFNALRAARNEYGADLVSLVRKFNNPENDGCGIAWLIGGGQSGIDSSDEFFGYSVVSDGRDMGTDGKTYFCREETLAHELGHNSGSQHDKAAAQGDNGTLESKEYGAYPYSFGYKTDAAGGNFYTVMAYGDTGQTNFRVFSNPRTTFCSQPCGIDGQADNARSLGQTIPRVATFRATVVPITPPPTSSARTRDDVDGDGKSDLLLANASLASSAYWIMNGAAPVRYSSAFAQPAGYARVATGDFNGDGKLDIVWARSSDRTLLLWQGDGNGFVQSAIRDYSPGWAVTGAGDIDGDGKSDLLLANAAQGLSAYWIMNGAAPVRYSAAFSQPGGYAQVATGDLNGDAKLDIVWARSSDRTLLLWQGDGNGFAQSAIRDYSAGWVVNGAGDVDGDGKSDLLLTNAGQGLTAYWVMSGATPLRYSAAFTQPAGYSRVATGDYNGDGRVDLVWARGSDRTLLLWQGDGTGFIQLPIRDYSAGWEVGEGGVDAGASPRAKAYARGDIDGDGRSDLLLRNAGSNLTAYWIMSGATPTRFSAAFPQPAGYIRVATGDFNGDGKQDLVWARSSDRSLLLWQGDGTGFAQLPIRDYAAGWAVTGAADVDGDGKSDLLLANASSASVAYWIMSGATPVRYSAAFVQPAGYAQVANGDFNADGRADLVWARSSDRNLLMWQGDGTGFSQAQVRDYSAGWTVTGAGDIDGDGRSDLLLDNAGQGLSAYWTMNGPTPLRYSTAFTQPAGHVRVATGDYNGDGKLDLVWARGSDRAVLVWQGDGTGFTSLPAGAYSEGWTITEP